MPDQSLFGTLIVLYLFLGGAGAGMLLVISAWSLAFHRTFHLQSERLQESFKSLVRRSYTIGLTVLLLSVFCLVFDLGSPERALNIFFRPHLTVLTFGAYILLIELALAATLSAINLFNITSVPALARKVLEWLCCLFSLATMIYTGVFLVSISAVVFWSSWSLILVFLLSALSSGISAVLLIDYFVKHQTLMLKAARPLQKVHVAVLVAEFLAVGAFIFLIAQNPASTRSIALLTSPDMLPIAIIGVVVLGMVVPLILESYNLRTKPYRSIPVSDVVCLIGGFFLRYVVIVCGLH